MSCPVSLISNRCYGVACGVTAGSGVVAGFSVAATSGVEAGEGGGATIGAGVASVTGEGGGGGAAMGSGAFTARGDIGVVVAIAPKFHRSPSSTYGSHA